MVRFTSTAKRTLEICTPSGLDVATCGVANATRFYSLATNFSRLLARLAPRFFVLKFLIEFNTLILSRSRMKPMKSCSILLLATLLGTLSSQDEFVDDDERRRVRSGSRTSSKAGKTNV